jgi:putative PIN family toxin of toxin-antitoxin system
MRVVIDTNVFVSSFFGGKPGRIINLWKHGEISLCLSSEIIDEYIEVLHRLLGPDVPEVEDLLGLFSSGVNILFTRTTPILNVVEKDPDDNKFIECAVKLKAEYIITGDNVLKKIKNYLNIRIVSPAIFLDIFRK